MYTREYLEDNIEEMFDAMGREYYIGHKDWYWEYNGWLRSLAHKINIPLIPVVGVFSSLSPNCSIDMNKTFTELYFKGIPKHTRANIAKAE